MRKLMNKKGFSLVELMIVVVIMGILIAVAIPLYSAIQTNANNKTCGTNIKNIQTNAASYMTNYNAKVTKVADLASMFADKQLPQCPLSKNESHTDDYKIEIDDNGAAKVQCLNVKEGVDHNPDGHTTVTTAIS